MSLESWYRQGLMVMTTPMVLTHGIFMLLDMTNVIVKDSWYRHGIDKDSWYRISTPESHTYEMAECCLYAGFFSYLRPLGPGTAPRKHP